jgi:hypothetical protein
LIVLTTSLASIISIIISQLVAAWITKRKNIAEIEKVQSDTSLSEGDLVLKYQKIAVDQADENIELSKKIKIQEGEKIELLTSLKALREEMITLDNSHKEEIIKLKESFEAERKENLMWKDWARRLVLQVQSWSLIPVPFSLEEAKKNGLFLGDIGRGTIEDK